MATGENFTRISGARAEAMNRERDKVIDDAINMPTTDKHILALREELIRAKCDAKYWETSSKDWEDMYISLEQRWDSRPGW